MDAPSEPIFDTKYALEVITIGGKHFAGISMVCPKVREIICVKHNGVKYSPMYDAGPFDYYYVIIETDTLKKAMEFEVYTTKYLSDTIICESTSMSTRCITIETLLRYCQIILEDAANETIRMIKTSIDSSTSGVNTLIDSVVDVMLGATRKVIRALEFVIGRCGGDAGDDPSYVAMIENITDINYKMENVAIDIQDLLKYLTELSETLRYVYDGPEIYEYNSGRYGIHSDHDWNKNWHNYRSYRSFDDDYRAVVPYEA
jgi:hypothetical protein